MLNYLCKCDWTNIIIRKWFIRKILTLLHILIKNTVHTKIRCIIHYHRNSIQGISERELSNGESKLGIGCMRCCSRWVWVFFQIRITVVYFIVHSNTFSSKYILFTDSCFMCFTNIQRLSIAEKTLVYSSSKQYYLWTVVITIRVIKNMFSYKYSLSKLFSPIRNFPYMFWTIRKRNN
jgi:hypothetical protein